MPRKKRKSSTAKVVTIKEYTRKVCGKKQVVKAHNRKKGERKKQGRLL